MNDLKIGGLVGEAEHAYQKEASMPEISIQLRPREVLLYIVRRDGHILRQEDTFAYFEIE